MKEEIVRQWIKKAKSDLKVVKNLINSKDPPIDMLCFHCQQAVEKYLKAFLTWTDVRVKKTHDLEAILNLCIEKSEGFEEVDKDKISNLALYAVEIRYPEETLNPSIQDAKDFYKFSRTIEDFVLKKLEELGLSFETNSNQ